MRRHVRDREEKARSWPAASVPALAGPEAPRQGLRPGGRQGERRLGRLLLGSALLHLLLVALVILASLRWKAPPEPVPPPSVEILFAPTPGPQKQPPGPPQRTQSASQPIARPAPRAAPAPAPAPPRPAVPPVAAPMPVPPAPRPAAPPAPAPPQAEAPPAVSLQAPGAATFGAPPPPVPIPAPPAPLPPARRPSDTAFAHPMDLSLRPAAPGANGLDLSFSGSSIQSALRPLTEMHSDQVGQDWMALFTAWLNAHASYPEAAGEAGQQGTVRVRFLVRRDGTVKSVQLVQSARSPWLDMAPAAWLRGARLPPLPPGTKETEATVDLTIRFVIVRH